MPNHLLLSSITVVLLIAAQPLGAQVTSPEAIAESYRDVDVKMTNPDPDMRLAYLTSIVEEGNANKIERAIRIAMKSKDEALRALGFRAYIASTGSLVLQIVMTPQDMAQIAQYQDRRISSLPRYIEIPRRINFSIGLQFNAGSVTSNKGQVSIGTGRPRPLDYVMRGERVTFGGISNFAGSQTTCNWELRPTMELKIIGTLACQDWGGTPLPLSAAMY